MSPGMPAQREADGDHDREAQKRMGDLRIIDIVERREPERARGLSGFRALEQAGAGVPVVELDRHERQVDQDQHTENDPERAQRPRRNRSEQKPVPVP